MFVTHISHFLDLRRHLAAPSHLWLQVYAPRNPQHKWKDSFVQKVNLESGQVVLRLHRRQCVQKPPISPLHRLY